MLIKNGGLSKRAEVQDEEGLTEPMAFLTQRDFRPAEFDCDQVEGLDLLCARLLARRLIPLSIMAFSFPATTDGREISDFLVLRLAHRHAVNWHKREPGLPHPARERVQRRGVLRMGYGEPREEALAMARADACGSACTDEGLAVVFRRYVGQVSPISTTRPESVPEM